MTDNPVTLEPNQIADQLMRTGSVVVMPTDTVYGLVARASDQRAVERLYALKDRHAKPGTLIGLNIDDLVSLGITRRYLSAVSRFWPGAVSVVIPINLTRLSYLTQGLPSLPIRVPDSKFLAQVLKITGPLITTSANLPTEPPAENILQAKKYFTNQVDAYYDGGSLANRQPSTIIRIIDDAVEVIRQGSVNVTDNIKFNQGDL